MAFRVNGIKTYLFALVQESYGSVTLKKFETHDTNLLSPRFFRRDQIWFTEKNRYGAKDLFCLAKFQLEDEKLINDDSAYKREYFQGRYGAIPLIQKFALQFGEVQNDR